MLANARRRCVATSAERRRRRGSWRSLGSLRSAPAPCSLLTRPIRPPRALSPNRPTHRPPHPKRSDSLLAASAQYRAIRQRPASRRCPALLAREPAQMNADVKPWPSPCERTSGSKPACAALGTHKIAEPRGPHSHLWQLETKKSTALLPEGPRQTGSCPSACAPSTRTRTRGSLRKHDRSRRRGERALELSRALRQERCPLLQGLTHAVLSCSNELHGGTARARRRACACIWLRCARKGSRAPCCS